MSKTITKANLNDMARYKDLDDYFSVDDSFPTAFLRAVGAIASSDGKVSLSEYDALKDIAKLSGKSAVAGAVLHHSLEHPLTMVVAFERLETAASVANSEIKKACFHAARPLLSLQGPDTKDITNKFAKALGYSVTEEEIKEICTTPNTSLWNIIAKKTLQTIRGKGMVDFAEECYRVSGETRVLEMVREFQNGKITEVDLRNEIVEECHEIQRQLKEYEETLSDVAIIEKAAKQFVDTVRELDNQVSQRIEMFSSRIKYEKRALKEDIDDAVHDAGNAIELDIQDRLRTDQWKLNDVWESISRTTFSKELAHRVDRLVNRREEILRIYQEELRLFQNELRVSQANILERVHHTNYAKYMPNVRMKTRITNAVEDAANIALWGGALSIAGTGAAAYMLGSTVIFTVMAPAAPFIGGAMIVAGVFKWFTNPTLRKADEIRHKREAFENVLREQLKIAQDSFVFQLEDLEEAFIKSKEQVIRPLLLEAEAAERLEGMQLEIAKRLIRNSRSATTRLITKLSALPA